MKKRNITLLHALFLFSAPSVLASDPPIIINGGTRRPTQAADGNSYTGRTDGIIHPMFANEFIIAWFINGITWPM